MNSKDLKLRYPPQEVTHKSAVCGTNIINSDIPSNDVATLISTINPINLDQIYKSQVVECKAAQAKYKNEALKENILQIKPESVK